MSKVLVEFPDALRGPGDADYTARVRGVEDEMHHWHGWIEFVPKSGGAVLQTARETTQSNYEQLEYWATGLTMPYLEMAIRRARPTSADEPAPPPAHPEPTFDPERIRDTHTDSSVVRLELETLDPSLPLRLMARPELHAGQVRRIPGAGIMVYDGATAETGEPSRHTFLLQYASENGAAVLANQLWSALNGEAAALRIDGEPVEVDNHDLNETLRERLPAHQ
jgi:hypothetical protein